MAEQTGDGSQSPPDRSVPTRPPNVGHPICSLCYYQFQQGQLTRRCASCWVNASLNPRRALCAACQSRWDAGGRKLCPGCNAVPANRGYDLCTACFMRWRTWQKPATAADASGPPVVAGPKRRGHVARALLSKLGIRSLAQSPPATSPPPQASFLAAQVQASPDALAVVWGDGDLERDVMGGAPAAAGGAGEMEVDSGRGGDEGHGHWRAVDWEAEKAGGADAKDKCPICLEELGDPPVPVVQLAACSHYLHAECADCALRAAPDGGFFKCPICGATHGTVVGLQPGGTMSLRREPWALPGHEQCVAIVLHYVMPSGVQGPQHPHPGVAYRGTRRVAYLPDCPEGRRVARLLVKAFTRRLVFTVGQSATTGADDSVIWAGLHHKTEISGGAANHGYPDPTYLSRVTEELAAVGVLDRPS
eukprot:m51a1_g13890 hypothetical protein (419) ;mRNA; r:672943-674605